MKQIADEIPADLVEASKELDEFEAFWKVYPRATNKAKAKVSFNRLSQKDKHNCLIGAQYHADNNPQWRDPTKVPHATTFINGKRWEDEIVEEVTPVDRAQVDQSKSPVDAVWSAFAQMWPSLFVSKYGEKPLPVWRTQVNKLPMVRVLRGIRYACNSKKEFPPSLPTFLGYCASTFEEENPTALPKPAGDPKVAQAAISEMLQILGCSPPKE